MATPPDVLSGGVRRRAFVASGGASRGYLPATEVASAPLFRAVRPGVQPIDGFHHGRLLIGVRRRGDQRSVLPRSVPYSHPHGGRDPIAILDRTDRVLITLRDRD